MARLVIKRRNYVFRGQEIKRKINKAQQEWLDRTGATTRKIARRSMKPVPKNLQKRSRFGERVQYRSGRRKGQTFFRKGRYAAPGMPPFTRRGEPNLRTIRWKVQNPNLMIVGPIKINRPRDKPIDRTVPNLLEFGGLGKFKRARGILKVNFQARPFMFPAGAKASKLLGRVSKRSIR